MKKRPTSNASSLAFIAAPAFAGPNTKLDLDAPPTVGFVNSNQDADLNLRIVVALKDGAPSTDYYFQLWCGPTHILSGPLIAVMDPVFTTNAQGKANSGAISFPASDLTTACGSGEHEGHVDVGVSPEPSFPEFTATPISFTAP